MLWEALPAVVMVSSQSMSPVLTVLPVQPHSGHLVAAHASCSACWGPHTH